MGEVPSSEKEKNDPTIFSNSCGNCGAIYDKQVHFIRQYLFVIIVKKVYATNVV